MMQPSAKFSCLLDFSRFLVIVPPVFLQQVMAAEGVLQASQSDSEDNSLILSSWPVPCSPCHSFIQPWGCLSLVGALLEAVLWW